MTAKESAIMRYRAMGSMHGRHQAGWGAAMGYPGIDLDEQGGEVDGFLFTSLNLSNHF